MCMGMHFPVSSEIFLSLKPGDEITLDPGFGYEPSEAQRTLIIASIDGFSALATDGTQLMCTDCEGISPTGVHHESWQLSEKAQNILEELGLL